MHKICKSKLNCGNHKLHSSTNLSANLKSCHQKCKQLFINLSGMNFKAQEFDSLTIMTLALMITIVFVLITVFDGFSRGDCPGLKSFSEGLQPLLPTLMKMTIYECYLMFSNRRIIMQAWRRLLPHSLYYLMFSNRRNKFLRRVPFLLSAIFICSIACFIYFYINKPNTKERCIFVINVAKL
ncbi:uncharacterized protein LOC120264531 [Dioscorea cayenensis subsp. rotundata]|uniref:Uncharacterized protein LOC120264531 n=1 Tax=Dioscorea cayennensis subsp. rotundata TaxID=55577 RepID=A0AB40BLL4_DIOCR|nr:uncharacterized protein LOC120264531 [Dioscorea cayenensis subsp. rotundata]